jgi:hypothetical protein
MTFPTLKEAYETFAAPPDIPDAALDVTQGRADFRAQMTRTVEDYADRISRWRDDIAQARAQIRDSLGSFLPQASPEDRAAALAELQALIEFVSEQIARDKRLVGHAKTRWGARIENLDPMPVTDVRFIRKQLDRGLDLIYERHDRQVEFYYFLLSLLAEYDPDSSDGPVFDNPDELDRYLRAQLEI